MSKNCHNSKAIFALIQADELFDIVEAFKHFVAPNTTTDRQLFLRKHLLNVHNKAVKTLQLEEIRLVSLVGCPGTAKTWCRWLVAYTLQNVQEEDPAPDNQEFDRDDHRQLPGEEAVRATDTCSSRS